jgi:carbamoyl-phosphate synthase/aspartate carbamoyltransferase/dihydroorotase
LKLYLNHTTGGFVVKQQDLTRLFTAWPEYLPILLHAEEKSLNDVLSVLRKQPRRIHLCHLSTRSELDAVMQAKAEGLPVTCGVTPHHLFLTRDDEKHLGPYGNVRPSLKSKWDVAYLWKHLAAIDCIESDHAPHTREEKGRSEAPSGVPGLETTLPLLLTAVHEGKLELHDIVRLCHDGPAKLFNVRQGKGTYVEVDLQKTSVFDNKNLFTKSGWTPFHGMKIKGKVLRTVINEQPVYENGAVLAPPGTGTIL